MTLRKRLGWLAPVLIPALLPAPAMAQDNLLIERGRPQQQTQTPPAMANDPTRPATALDAVTAPNVNLSRVIIEGAPAGPEIERAWRPLVGRPLDAANLRAIADAVAQAYGQRAALYTVNLPAQTFDGGVVRLRVIEGHFENAVIAGKVKDRDMRLIQAYAAKLTAETPLRKVTLERYISLIRDIPGLTPDLQLLQGATPGGVKLVINIKEERFTWGLGINNRGSALLDREQVNADFTWNSTLRQGDQTRLSLASSADWDSAKAVALSHSTPLGSDGARLDVSGAWLQTKIAALAVQGEATSAGIGVSYPVIRGYRDNLYVSFSLDGINSDNAVLGQIAFSEHTRNGRASAVYSRARPKAAISLSAVITQGIDGLGARVNPLLAEPDYLKGVVRAGVDRKLGQTVTLRLRGAAQTTGDILPVSEQFGLGGDAFGRGFANSLLLGDKGTAGSVEAGWAPKAIKGAFQGSEIYAFADAGEVKTNGRPTIPAGHETLSSAGGGVRLAIRSGYVIGLEAAKPVDAPATVGKDWRYAFNVRSKF